MGRWFSVRLPKQRVLRWAAGGCLLAGVGLFSVGYAFWYAYPLTTNTPVRLVLPPGQGLQRVWSTWAAQLQIPYPRLWLRAICRWGQLGPIRSGEYIFQPGMALADLVRMLRDGSVVQYPFRLGAGWTVSFIQDMVTQYPALRRDWPASDPIVACMPGFQNCEGLFFPDTYMITWGDSLQGVLLRAHQRLWDYVQKCWSTRAPGLPYQSAYEALIAASIIEKETGIPEERFQIAGVLVRRLQRGMPLQMDPTVIYGLGAAYSGRLDKAALQHNTPYNTYLHKGLPPTPIGLASPESIEAALHPAAGNALYFVVKGDGTHVFSDTLASHQQAVRAWVHALQAVKKRPPVEP